MVFAVFALVMVGVSWSLTGIVMSDAPRKKCDPALLLMASGFVSCVVSVTLCLSLQKELLPWKVILLTGGCYFLAAVINYCMLQIMAHVMQKGPNGVIWSIIQSGLVFPFLAGVIFYDSTLTWGRISGLSLICYCIRDWMPWPKPVPGVFPIRWWWGPVLWGSIYTASFS